jgi:hypothetical protein
MNSRRETTPGDKLSHALKLHPSGGESLHGFSPIIDDYSKRIK